MSNVEPIAWSCNWNVRKFDEDATSWLSGRLGRDPVAADFEAARIDPYKVGTVERNLLVNTGLTRITSLITAGGTQALTLTSGRIGVGDNSTAASAAVTDTALNAATNKLYQPLDSGYPTAVTGVITVQSTFTGALANFAWNEFCIDIGTPTVVSNTTANTLLNHKTGIAQGTKTSGQTWVAQATITIS